jgi:hypothetical protein
MKARTILMLLCVFLIVGFFAGWVKFSQGPDQATITIDKSEIKKEAHEAVDAGKNLIHKAADAVKHEPNNRTSSPDGTSGNR